MSINLTNAVVVSSGGTQLENDTVAGCSTFTVDCSTGNPVFIATYSLGTGIAGSTVTAGKYPTPIQLSVNLLTGVWSTTNGKGGTLDAGSLAGFTTSLKSLRNTVESFATANTIVTGTQVPW